MPIDYKRYPPNWKSELVPAVIARAKNQCECCGLDNKQTVYAIKMDVRDPLSGRYKSRSLWFRDKRDAMRESGSVESMEELSETVPHEFNIKSVKVCLTVAHLDHDETNHDVKIDRLRAWCQLCHLRYDAAEKYRRINSKQNLFTQHEESQRNSGAHRAGDAERNRLQ